MGIQVNLFSIAGTDTLRFRENAQKIFNYINKMSTDNSIILDWANINFASRSFLHELLKLLSHYNVQHINQSNNVQDMKKIMFIKPEYMRGNTKKAIPA